jgi:hypothetical protein
MKIEIEELPDTLSEEIRKLLRMVYEAGWGAARLSETSGCGKLNRNRR